jgi:hypothetical protein
MFLVNDDPLLVHDLRDRARGRGGILGLVCTRRNPLDIVHLKRQPEIRGSPPIHRKLPLNIIQEQCYRKQQRSPQDDHGQEQPPQRRNCWLGRTEQRCSTRWRMHCLRQAHKRRCYTYGQGAGDPSHRLKMHGEVEELGDADADGGREDLAE